MSLTPLSIVTDALYRLNQKPPEHLMQIIERYDVASSNDGADGKDWTAALLCILKDKLVHEGIHQYATNPVNSSLVFGEDFSKLLRTPSVSLAVDQPHNNTDYLQQFSRAEETIVKRAEDFIAGPCFSDTVYLTELANILTSALEVFATANLPFLFEKLKISLLDECFRSVSAVSKTVYLAVKAQTCRDDNCEYLFQSALVPLIKIAENIESVRSIIHDVKSITACRPKAFIRAISSKVLIPALFPEDDNCWEDELSPIQIRIMREIVSVCKLENPVALSVVLDDIFRRRLAVSNSSLLPNNVIAILKLIIEVEPNLGKNVVSGIVEKLLCLAEQLSNDVNEVNSLESAKGNSQSTDKRFAKRNLKNECSKFSVLVYGLVTKVPLDADSHIPTMNVILDKNIPGPMNRISRRVLELKREKTG